MKVRDMTWVHRLLVICITIKFTGLSSTAIRNITETSQYNHIRAKRLDSEYVDSRDAYNSSNDVPNEVTKRSIATGLDDDIGAEDIMTAAFGSKPQDGDTQTEKNNEKRSTLDCEEHSMECPAIHHNLETPSYLDLSIGNEVPITMERSSELTAEATPPDDIFNEQESANIMIQNEAPIALEHFSKLTANATLPVDIPDERPNPNNPDGRENANIMFQNEAPLAMEHENELTASATSPAPVDIVDEQNMNTYWGNKGAREKRDSIRSENPFYETFVSPDISAMIRNKNENQGAGSFDFDTTDDLMKAMNEASLSSADSNQVFHNKEAPIAEEHVSTLTVEASPAKKVVHTVKNYNTMKKELIAEVAMMKNVSHIKKDKHHNKHHKKHTTKHASHKKHTKQKKSKVEQVSQRLPPIADRKKSELTAKATSPKDTRGKSSKNSKRSKIESTNGELKSIFTEMRSAKHKLTRNDIRKLAKTAVMLAALKSHEGLEPMAMKSEKRHSIAKPKHNKTAKKKKTSKKENKKKAAKKAAKSHVAKVDMSEGMNSVRTDTPEMSFNMKDLSNQPEFTLNHNLDKDDGVKKEKVKQQLDITVEQPTAGKSEFSEDITVKKSKSTGVSDDAMGNLAAKNVPEEDMKTTVPTTPKPMQQPSIDTISETDASVEPTGAASLQNILATTPMTTIADGAADLSKELALKVITDGNIISKKSEVTRPDDDIEKAISDYDTNDLLNMIDSSNADKKNLVPSKEISDSMATLKSVLSKVSPNKVPNNFLPDIPAGLRMIAWKKLLEKKRSQLLEYESAVGVSEATAGVDSLNIADQKGDDVTSYTKMGDDKETFAKKSSQADQIKDLENDESASFMTAAVGHDEETARHVHYLKKHIAGARTLRKLIAKTLVGHCKSTGKRILAAFIAMDKALERAQAIATVIGGKFNVDPNKIENLVSDKEDQVVETFLRDIFTKL